jgi:ATP-dependent DNA helicase PIF1
MFGECKKNWKFKREHFGAEPKMVFFSSGKDKKMEDHNLSNIKLNKKPSGKDKKMEDHNLSNIKLNKKQQEAYDKIMSGKSIFLTGEAGTGKSVVIQKFIHDQKKFKRCEIGLTSTTGASALIIGGATLHSFLGIGLGDGEVEDLVKRIQSRKYVTNRWKALKVLIIDEVSMLSPVLFDRLSEVAHLVRSGHHRSMLRSKKEYGWDGIQLVLTGDFCQLPVVKCDKYTFEATSWNDCVEETIILKENVRQTNDATFQKILSDFRLGKVSEEQIKVLLDRVRKKVSVNGVEPTKLCAVNYQVRSINQDALDDLAAIAEENDEELEFIQFDMKVEKLNGISDKIVQKHKDQCIADESIQLCVGAQVMLVKNVYAGEGEERELIYCNGSRGVVKDFTEGDSWPVVEFTDGGSLTIENHDFEIRGAPTKKDKNGKVEVVLTQIPLRVAYAISIHKSQGMTMDCVEVDLSRCFCAGQAYVALSRVKSLNGLTLSKRIEMNNIKADPRCVEFYSAR